MTSRAQQQKNINDTHVSWGTFVDLWRKSVPHSKTALINYASLASSKRSYG